MCVFSVNYAIIINYKSGLKGAMDEEEEEMFGTGCALIFITMFVIFYRDIR